MNTERHDDADLVPIAMAAQTMGTTPLNVLMHIKRGLLVGREHEDGWLVDPESLAALLRRRAGGELPAVCESGCGKKASGCGSCS